MVFGLALIAGGAGLLTQLKASQKLGPPGVLTAPLPGSIRLEVLLPEKVLDYSSEKLPTDQLVLDTLPKDTSFGQRRYTAADGFTLMINAVLMGSDRTSLHKPEFCLSGFGWLINKAAEDRVKLANSVNTELPVMRFDATKEAVINGQTITASGLYVFWFVEEEQTTARHWQRMWWMTESMLRTGKLQRWAYISCFAVCNPGAEEATYARMKEFLATAAPQFQTAGMRRAAREVGSGL
jgi:hypothetical protein